MPRDEFNATVKANLAKRVGQRCSNPNCSSPTCGPHSDPHKAVSIGVAAHISAASPGGPRYDVELEFRERSSIENAIWLCQTCAKLVDSDITRFTAQELRRWKVVAETKTMRALKSLPTEDYYPQPATAMHIPIPKVLGLPYDDARERLMEAGWQPHLQHWSYANEVDIQYGDGQYFWNKGYHEIINACGTGLSQCTFGFVDVYQNKLIVGTAGEVIEELNSTACVWSWHFKKTLCLTSQSTRQ